MTKGILGMDAQGYARMSAPIRNLANGPRALTLVDRGLVILVACSYIALIVYLTSTDNPFALRAVIVPAVSLLFMSALRSLIDAPRPYEQLDIDPLIVKDTRGKSFPGRHAFSATMIAVTFLRVSLPLGILFLLIAALICFIRVLGGIHYPRDVTAGAVLACICGIIGFWVF